MKKSVFIGALTVAGLAAGAAAAGAKFGGDSTVVFNVAQGIPIGVIATNPKLASFTKDGRMICVRNDRVSVWRLPPLAKTEEDWHVGIM